MNIPLGIRVKVTEGDGHKFYRSGFLPAKAILKDPCIITLLN